MNFNSFRLSQSISILPHNRGYYKRKAPKGIGLPSILFPKGALLYGSASADPFVRPVEHDGTPERSFLRRAAPYKGLHPLRCFAAIRNKKTILPVSLSVKK